MMTLTSSAPGVAVEAYKPLSSPRFSCDSTNDHDFLDPEELTDLLRRARTPSPDEIKERHEDRAKQNHGHLIEMGGRPTRSVQLQPTWTATYKDGLIYIFDSQGGLECTLPDNIDPMLRHWQRESAQFERELENWQKFRRYQQKVLHLDRLETELELDNTDAGLFKALAGLSDWQEFEVFQHLILAEALKFEDHCGQNFLQITKWEVASERFPISSAAHDAIGPWLRPFDQSQEEIEAAKSHLSWVKDQWPKVVAEAIDSISMTPEYQTVLEEKFRKQTNGAFGAILKLGGRPSHAVKLPNESMDILHRLLLWSSETAKYMEELLDWKMFLEWRRHDLSEKLAVPKQEYQCPKFESALEFFAEFEKFRLYQNNLASFWLTCRQRVLRWYEEEIETPRWYVDEFKPPQANVTPGFLYHYAEAARSHVKDSEQKLADAAMRLEEARQEHAGALRGQGQSTGGETGLRGSQGSLQSSQSSSSFSSQSSLSSLSSLPLKDSQSPQSSQSSRSSPSPRSPKRLCNDQRPSSDSSTTEKRNRRSKKQNAKKKGARSSSINTRQQPLPAFPIISHNVKEDNDIHPTKAPSSPSPKTEQQLLNANSEDAAMTDFDNPLDDISYSSQSLNNPITYSTTPPNIPSPTAQAPPPRTTRSATKALSNRVLKNKNKKPAKKAKAFTEQQKMTLLNASSTDAPLTPCPLRRSDRLKQKAATSALAPATQPNPFPSSHSSPQPQPQKLSTPAEPARSSKRKMQHHVEPTDDSSQGARKKQKMQSETLEGSGMQRRKKRRMRLE